MPSEAIEQATAVTADVATPTVLGAPKVAPLSLLSRTSTVMPSVRTEAIMARVPFAARPTRGPPATVATAVHTLKSLVGSGCATRWRVSAPVEGSMRTRSSAPSPVTAAAQGPSGSEPL